MDIIFLSCGPEYIHLQTAFCILSLNYVLGAKFEQYRSHIFIYTDHPEFFRSYPVQIEKIEPEKWLSGRKYFFYLKPQVLNYHYKEHDTSLLFIDSDTYFKKDPTPYWEKISPKCSLMYCNEAPSLLERAKKEKVWNEFIEGHSSILTQYAPKITKQELQMWNSGVLGIHQDLCHLLPLIMEFTDACVATGVPIHTYEQFAFTLILAQQGSLSPSTDFLFHYFHHKYKDKINPFLKKELAPFTQAPFQEQEALYKKLKEPFSKCRTPP